MTNINCVLVYSDGRSETIQDHSWVSATHKILDSIKQAGRDRPNKPIVRILTSTGNTVVDHTQAELFEALADGTMAQMDADHASELRRRFGQ